MATLQMNQSPNKGFYYLLLFLSLAVLVIIVFPFKGCEQTIDVETIEIKKEILKDKAKKDSIKERIVYKDREHLVYITKWRNLKPQLDTLPCPDALEQVITLTDSIIVADSSLISSLKAEIFVDSLIISNQDKVIKTDSIVIRRLTKKLKRQKVKTALAGVLGFGLGLLVK